MNTDFDMLLNRFMDDFEEDLAKKRVRDFLKTNESGELRAEFLGHFLTSVFQPVFEIRGTQLQTVGFEAFIRPVAGDKGLSPLDYFESLDSTNISFVDQLCHELHVVNFVDQSQSFEFISINVQPEALLEHLDQFDEIKKRIQTADELGLSPENILVELDISPNLDAGDVFTFANALREIGVSTTLENFDADCASFARILHNKPNVVKFNRSWLEYATSGRKNLDLVSGVVTTLKSLGIKSHIEFIENKTELEFAIACGFHRFQGFYLAKPEEKVARPTWATGR